MYPIPLSLCDCFKLVFLGFGGTVDVGNEFLLLAQHLLLFDLNEAATLDDLMMDEPMHGYTVCYESNILRMLKRYCCLK